MTSQDVSYDEARNLHNKWLKHQAFMAELASHQGWLESIDAVSSEVLRCASLSGTSPRPGHRPAVCGAAQNWEVKKLLQIVVKPSDMSRLVKRSQNRCPFWVT